MREAGKQSTPSCSDGRRRRLCDKSLEERARERLRDWEITKGFKVLFFSVIYIFALLKLKRIKTN